MKALKKIVAPVVAVMCSPAVESYASTMSPAAGNTESSTYIWIIAGAGVIAAAAVIAGIFTKKKKK